MSGQSANMNRKEVISKSKAVECGPSKTSGGSSPDQSKKKK